MNLTRRAVLGGAASLALAGCAALKSPLAKPAPTPPAPDAATRLKAALGDLSTEILRVSPERATALGVSEAQAGGPYLDRLSDYSLAGLRAKAGVAASGRAGLEEIDPGQLSPEDAISRDIVGTAMSYYEEGAQFGYGVYGLTPPQPYVVTQNDGAYSNVPDYLDSVHPLHSTADAKAYLACLHAYAKVLDQESARIALDAKAGVIPPDFVINGAVKQIAALAAQNPKDTVLVRSLTRRLPAAGIADAEIAATAGQAADIVASEIDPAYRRQIEALKAVRPSATHEAGAAHLPQGDAYYEAALRARTTASLAPDEIHKMGLDLVADLNGQLDAAFKAQGMKRGTPAERLQELFRRPGEVYPNTDKGRALLISHLNSLIADVQPYLKANFKTVATTPLEIKRVPSDIEAGAPGGYYSSGSLDGSRPGTYYINLRNTAEYPKFTLPTLTYHEGEPGHHWQITIAQHADLPFIRRALLGFSGYAEGWALYAEQLADEMGLYKSDPLGHIGYLQSMIFRAARLVTDTGLHHLGWSREKAIDYMFATTGYSRTEMTTEVERYCVWPGQACAYMVGRQTINRLRGRAKAALGPKFDLSAFHDALLTSGSMPLDVLDKFIAQWTAARLSA